MNRTLFCASCECDSHVSVCLPLGAYDDDIPPLCLSCLLSAISSFPLLELAQALHVLSAHLKYLSICGLSADARMIGVEGGTLMRAVALASIRRVCDVPLPAESAAGPLPASQVGGWRPTSASAFPDAVREYLLDFVSWLSFRGGAEVERGHPAEAAAGAAQDEVSVSPEVTFGAVADAQSNGVLSFASQVMHLYESTLNREQLAEGQRFTLLLSDLTRTCAPFRLAVVRSRTVLSQLLYPVLKEAVLTRRHHAVAEAFLFTLHTLLREARLSPAPLEMLASVLPGCTVPQVDGKCEHSYVCFTDSLVETIEWYADYPHVVANALSLLHSLLTCQTTAFPALGIGSTTGSTTFGALLRGILPLVLSPSEKICILACAVLERTLSLWRAATCTNGLPTLPREAFEQTNDYAMEALASATAATVYTTVDLLNEVAANLWAPATESASSESPSARLYGVTSYTRERLLTLLSVGQLSRDAMQRVLDGACLRTFLRGDTVPLDEAGEVLCSVLGQKEPVSGVHAGEHAISLRHAAQTVALFAEASAVAAVCVPVHVAVCLSHAVMALLREVAPRLSVEEDGATPLIELLNECTWSAVAAVTNRFLVQSRELQPLAVQLLAELHDGAYDQVSRSVYISTSVTSILGIAAHSYRLLYGGMLEQHLADELRQLSRDGLVDRLLLVSTEAADAVPAAVLMRHRLVSEIAFHHQSDFDCTAVELPPLDGALTFEEVLMRCGIMASVGPALSSKTITFGSCLLEGLVDLGYPIDEEKIDTALLISTAFTSLCEWTVDRSGCDDACASAGDCDALSTLLRLCRVSLRAFGKLPEIPDNRVQGWRSFHFGCLYDCPLTRQRTAAFLQAQQNDLCYTSLPEVARLTGELLQCTWSRDLAIAMALAVLLDSERAAVNAMSTRDGDESVQPEARQQVRLQWDDFLYSAASYEEGDSLFRGIMLVVRRERDAAGADSCTSLSLLRSLREWLRRAGDAPDGRTAQHDAQLCLFERHLTPFFTTWKPALAFATPQAHACYIAAMQALVECMSLLGPTDGSSCDMALARWVAAVLTSRTVQVSELQLFCLLLERSKALLVARHYGDSLAEPLRNIVTAYTSTPHEWQTADVALRAAAAGTAFFLLTFFHRDSTSRWPSASWRQWYECIPVQSFSRRSSPPTPSLCFCALDFIFSYSCGSSPFKVFADGAAIPPPEYKAVLCVLRWGNEVLLAASQPHADPLQFAQLCVTACRVLHFLLHFYEKFVVSSMEVTALMMTCRPPLLQSMPPSAAGLLLAGLLSLIPQYTLARAGSEKAAGSLQRSVIACAHEFLSSLSPPGTDDGEDGAQMAAALTESCQRVSRTAHESISFPLHRLHDFYQRSGIAANQRTPHFLLQRRLTLQLFTLPS